MSHAPRIWAQTSVTGYKLTLYNDVVVMLILCQDSRPWQVAISNSRPITLELENVFGELEAVA